jgi:hypothetical protein
MRSVLGAISLLLLAGSAHAAELWSDRLAQWEVGAYSLDDTGEFGGCLASAKYRSGISVLFAISPKFVWSVGFTSPEWHLREGAQYSINYWVDDGQPNFAMARATTERSVIVILKNDIDLFNSFRYGRTLHVNAQATNLGFNLTNTSQVLTYLAKCASAHGARVPVEVATVNPNPFGPPAANPSAARTPTSTPSSIEAERAEATLIAANLMSELGINGFKLLRRDEMPNGTTADAMWRTDKNVGTVTVLPKVDDPARIAPVIISDDAKSCKKAFASGSEPVEQGSTITRLFTRCGMGSDAFVGLYLVVPRKAGGVYVIGTFATGEEDGARTVDTNIRAAVFRALPQSH